MQKFNFNSWLLRLALPVLFFASINNTFALNVNSIPSLSHSDLIFALNNPKLATGVRFDLKDNQGNSLQTPSIIQMSGQAYKYAAVYHTPYPVAGNFRYKVNLAVSNNLMDWFFIRTLVDNASMPKIAAVTGADWLVLIHEQWLGPGPATSGPCQVGFELFYNFNDLLNGTIRSQWIAPQYKHFLNGTPSIYEFHLSFNNGYYAVDGQYGFHYWDGTRDTNAAATVINLFHPLGGTVSYPSTTTAYNQLLINKGVSGNLGQRDTLVTANARYNIQEGNVGIPAESWEKWRLWLYRFVEPYSYPTGNGSVVQLLPQTPNGSFSFGNPGITVVDSPSGKGKALVVSYFIFSEGAGSGEAGSLLFYFDLDTLFIKKGIWGLDGAGQIFQYNGNGGWNQIGGYLSKISVGTDGTVWGINSAGAIFRYNGNGGWIHVPGALSQISVGNSGAVWGLDGANQIFQYNSNGGWNHIGGSLSKISVGANGTVWGLDGGGQIFRYNGKGGWIHVPGTLTQISVGSSGAVWGLDGSNQIFKYNGSGGWIHIAGSLSQISVGSNGAVWGLDGAGQIFRYNGKGGWIHIAGSLSKISVGPNNTVWGVNSAGAPFQYNGKGGWNYIPGALSQISVAK